MNMVVASTVASTTTSMSVTTKAAVNETNSVFSSSMGSPQPSVSRINGQQEGVSVPNVSPNTYQMLLKQVENLRLENNTLKAELKNNTSHISKLENEASSLKDMVILLGISGGNEVDTASNNNLVNTPRSNPTPDDNARICENSALPKAYSLPYSPMKMPERDGMKQRLDLPLGSPLQPNMITNFQQNGAHCALSPPPSLAVADVIKKHLLNLKKDRANILRSVQSEEHKKDYYMKQLKEMNRRLDNVSESDKFTKPSDKTRQQIEMEIANLQKTMEQTLGTSAVMEERLQGWLKDIQEIEKEIHSLDQYLHKLETTPTSHDLPGFPDLNSYLDNIADQGSCTRHTSYSRGTISFFEMSTQTPKGRKLDGITYEEEFSSGDNWILDVQISAEGGRVSRPVQTIASCLAGRLPQNNGPAALFEMPGLILGQNDPLSSRYDHKPRGSVESLPSQSDIDETASMHSFTTSLPRQFQTNTLNAKKDGLHSPSSLLTASKKEEICHKFHRMSKSIDGCFTLRQTGCLPIIVKIIHDGSMLNPPPSWTSSGPGDMSSTMLPVALKTARDMRLGMSQLLKNIVHSTSSDMKKSKLEAQILNQLEIIRCYCEQLLEHWVYSQRLRAIQNGDEKYNANHSLGNNVLEMNRTAGDTKDSLANGPPDTFDFRSGLLVLFKPPMPSISTIMKLSHNEAIRGVINELGGLFAVAELFILHCRCMSSTEQVYAVAGNDLPQADERITNQLQLLRRFVGFALINLTYGDMANKATLIQMPGLVDMVAAQLETDSEEMQQVMARFLRNLSWQPDEKCRDILRQKSIVTVLMKCALRSKREVTLKSVLSALWNLSGHCPENRVSICSVKGALAFLVSTLTYRNQSKSPAIIESGGGILRNVSSVVATNEEYRQILRDSNCLQILLTHLKAASLTIVSNACGTLWNLSARNAKDQKLLWDLGAVNMLRNLVHSKHSVIAQGSSAALRNLLANRPDNVAQTPGHDGETSESSKLQSRKQKMLDSFGHTNNATEVTGAENFSPRHHARGNSNQENMSSARSTLSPQRRSLQETSSSSPAPDFDKSGKFRKPGLHYSGSLGNLPNTDFGDTSKSLGATKYVAAARNSNSYPDHYSSNATNSGSFGFRSATMNDMTYTNQVRPAHPSGFTSLGGMMKDVMIFNDATSSQLSQGQRLLMGKPEDMSSSLNKTSPQTKLSYLQCLQMQMMNSGKMPQVVAASASPVIMPQQSLHYTGINIIPAAPGARGYRDEGSQHSRNPSLSQNVQSPNRPTSQSPYLPNGSMTKVGWANSNGTGGLSHSVMSNDFSQMPQMRNQVLGLARLQNQAKNPQIPPLNLSHSMPSPGVYGMSGTKGNCPDDLARRLQNVEEDYNDDDDLVNYSLQYRDEHMTPGIRSPRTEEIYETGSVSSQAKRFLQSQMGGSTIPSSSVNGPATPSDGGMSGLSSCIGSTGSGNALVRQDSNNNPNLQSMVIQDQPRPGPPLQDRQTSSSFMQPGGSRYSGDPRMMDPSKMYYNDDLEFEDEKPTNFGAIYSEEQLYDPIQPESVGMMPFSGMGGQTEKFSSIGNQSQDHMVRNSEPQHTNDPQNFMAPGEETDRKASNANELRQEEEDKFDTGAITPGHYYHHKSGRNSGIMTPRTPMFQETPLMFSRSSSLDSVSSCDAESIRSSVTSEPGSRMMSGFVSPSQLPDSPSQSMPVSPRRTPRSMSLNNLHQQPPKVDVTKPDPKDNLNEPEHQRDQTSADIVNNPDSRAQMCRHIEERLEKLEQPGYVSSLPHHDETSAFKSEGSMSLITTFSALTTDTDDKIQPILHNTDVFEATAASGINPDSKQEERQHEEEQKPGSATHPGQIAVMNAGYITSLPTNDEIKNFMHEGSLSPMTCFSEISCLKESNEGFQKGSGSLSSLPNSSSSNKVGGSQSVVSNKNSYASRSSATGASVPPPLENWRKNPDSDLNIEQEEDRNTTDAKDSSSISNLTSPTSLEGSSKLEMDEEEDDDDSLPSSSDDEDDDLLQQCIEHGLPKKKSSSRGWSSKSSAKSTSSKSSSKSNKSSRSKDKDKSSSSTSKEKSVLQAENPSPAATDDDTTSKAEDRSVINPSPEVVRERIKRINIKQKIDAANSKLNGLHIVQYIDNLMTKTNYTNDEGGASGSNGSPTITGAQKSKQIIGNVETLEQTYSVKKRLKETEKQASKTSQQVSDDLSGPTVSMPKTTGFLPSEHATSLQSSLRIQTYIREGMANYAMEGTPIEMSRSTSLSNLTIDSDGLEHNDFQVLQSRLKSSHSVPDINSAEKTGPVSMTGNHEVSTIPLHVSAQERSSRATDSREILEDLGRQIDNLSLKTVEAAIASKYPGYMTSLPHTDEITKFASEGSQSGLTVFSTLTIDSDTRIAPSVPIEAGNSPPKTSDPSPSGNIAPLPSAGNIHNQASDTGISFTTELISNSNCEQIDNSNQDLFVPRGRSYSNLSVEEASYATSSSKEDVTVIQNTQLVHHPAPDISCPTNLKSSKDALQPPPSHYCEKDPVTTKEGLLKFEIEHTPVCFSSNSSLSSLDFGSDGDDLLNECISWALPVDKKNGNPPPPNQLPTQVPIHPNIDPDMIAQYNGRLPDGKVDSPTTQQAPYMTHQNMPFNLQMMREHTFISNPSAQSPTDDQWAQFQQDANAISAQLLQNTGHYQSAIQDLKMVSPSRRTTDSRIEHLPCSSSYNSLSQPHEGFRHLSRQSSMPDSDISANSLIPGDQQVQQMRKSGSRQVLELKASPRRRGLKGGKKYLSPSMGKQSSRHQHNQESSSGSSSSYNHKYHHHQQPQHHRHVNNNNARINITRNQEICSKCQPVCSRPNNQSRCLHHTVSASTGRLENLTSPTRMRRKSTNSGSKNSTGLYEHNPHQHQSRPSRTRVSAQNVYYPSVTQLYPPLKDMSGVLMGVASVAARGDKVLAERSAYHPSRRVIPAANKKSSNSSSSTGPALVKQGTFITDRPSPVLLQNMTKEERDLYRSKSTNSTLSISPSHSRRSVRSNSSSKVASPRGSTHSLKSHSVVSTAHATIPKQKPKKKSPVAQAKPKHNKVWNGIKKLLSPSDDVPRSSKEIGAMSHKDIAVRGSKSPKISNKKQAISKTQQKNKPQHRSTVEVKKTGESGSSLSLSSSSLSNNSGSELDFGTGILAPNDSMTPFGHLPKSPSVNALAGRTISAIPSSHSTGGLQDMKLASSGKSVWRRTPPPPNATNSRNATDSIGSSQYLPTSSYTSLSSANNLQRSRTSISSNSRSNQQSLQGADDSTDVWVAKKDSKGQKKVATSSNSKLPVPPGQKQVLYSDGGNAEATEHNPETNEPVTAGFIPPPRTHSPRVVQQVAPFNYNPSPKKPSSLPSLPWREKQSSSSKRISPDCKQTSV